VSRPACASPNLKDDNLTTPAALASLFEGVSPKWYCYDEQLDVLSHNHFASRGLAQTKDIRPLGLMLGTEVPRRRELTLHISFHEQTSLK
jgi:hypothetical protein